MPTSHVRSAALTNYAEVARALGVDPFAQLRAAGLDAHCLVNPDLKVPVLRVNALLESSAHAAGVEDFGLRMAMSRRLSNLGLISLAAREQPTVRDALSCLQRTLHLHNEALSVQIEEAGGVAVVREQVLARVHGSMRQSVELATGVLFRTVREFMGASWSPMAVCFMHAPPRNLARYRNAFRCSVQFNSILNGITCRSRDLDRPTPRADPDSLRTIQQLVNAAAEHHPTQAQRATQLILSLLPTGRCTSTLVARYLDIDRRTLHRKLATEHTSFSMLVDHVRTEAARRHLADPARSIADLAPVLGFSDSSALSRWFTTRFGLPPGRWRNSVPGRPGAT
jgi:AraC-like DNA-binding protein